jgi:hypothetical protein
LGKEFSYNSILNSKGIVYESSNSPPTKSSLKVSLGATKPKGIKSPSCSILNKKGIESPSYLILNKKRILSTQILFSFVAIKLALTYIKKSKR